jgi:adenylate cyclase
LHSAVLAPIEFDRGAAMARDSYPTMMAGMIWRKYIFAIPYGVRLPDASALRDTAATLAAAEQSGDDLALDLARTTRGVSSPTRRAASAKRGSLY